MAAPHEFFMPETTNTKSASALNLLESHLDPTSARFEKNMRAMAELVAAVRTEQEKIGEGGGPKAVDAQHAKGRLTARERIELLLDKDAEFFELGIYAAHRMYEEWGGAPAAGRRIRPNAGSAGPT